MKSVREHINRNNRLALDSATLPAFLVIHELQVHQIRLLVRFEAPIFIDEIARSEINFSHACAMILNSQALENMSKTE
jgi:hypothetical protein